MMWLLQRLLDRELAESILGDLEDCARTRYPVSPLRATLWKWRQIVSVVIAALAERMRDAVTGSRPVNNVAPHRWSRRWVAELFQDSGHALRMFRRQRGFAAAAILTLALGIGCSTAIFSVVNALLLRSLPYDETQALVQIGERMPIEEAGIRIDAFTSISPADVFELRARSQTLSHVGLHLTRTMTMTARGQAVRVFGARVSPSVFDMLRNQPVVGRTFTAEEESVGAERTAVLSFAAWQKYFNGDPDILKRRVFVDGELTTVVGVMGPGFYFPDRQTDLWVPFTLSPTTQGRFPVVARMREHVSLTAVRDEVTALLSPLRDEPAPPGSVGEGPPLFDIVPVREALTMPVKPALTVLMVAVGLVLVIACTNVANLLVARGLSRRRETSIRGALGAGRFRLVRQVLTETVLLAAAGGVVGIVIAVGLIEVLQTIGTGLLRDDLLPPLSIPRLDEVRLDATALIFTVSVSVLTGIVFGLIPALAQSRADAMDLLRADGGANVGIGGRRPLQGGLIVLQITAATILLVAAGLQIHSFAKLARVNPGYDSSHILTFQVAFPDEKGTLTFAEDLVAEIEPLPGVRAVGYSTALPMVQRAFISPVSRTKGPPPSPPPFGAPPSPEFPDTRLVSREFLEALGVPVTEGRGLSSARVSSGIHEILVNRAFARTGFLGDHPIGQRVYAGGRLAEVVGVVNDVRQFGLEQPATPQVFGLLTGDSDPSLYYAVGTSGEPTTQIATIRQIVRRLVPEAGLYNVATMDQILASSVGRERLYAVLMGIFAVIAAALAAIGLYGLVAHAVALRTREIGIRVALGARPHRVLGLMMRDVAVLLAIGLVLGLGGAVAATRSLESMLFELSPLDPATYVVVATLFMIVSFGAAFVAARRATAADPVVALRSE